MKAVPDHVNAMLRDVGLPEVPDVVPEASIRADERDRCRREAFVPNGSCPCCGRQDASDYERALRSKEEQIQRLLRDRATEG